MTGIALNFFVSATVSAIKALFLRISFLLWTLLGPQGLLLEAKAGEIAPAPVEPVACRFLHLSSHQPTTHPFSDSHLGSRSDSISIRRLKEEHPKTWEAYFRGDSQVDFWMGAAERWRRDLVHPSKTHLPEVAAQLDFLLAYVETSLRGQPVLDIERRLRTLEYFREEARVKKSQGRVTYRWWLLFNFRLSVLLTETGHRGLGTPQGSIFRRITNPPRNVLSPSRIRWLRFWKKSWVDQPSWETEQGTEAMVLSVVEEGKTTNLLRRMLEAFPKSILIPTPLGVVGLSPLNQTYYSEVGLVGVFPERMILDGQGMFPDTGFYHDLVHFEFQMDQIEEEEKEERGERKDERSLGRKKAFMREFLSYRQSLTLEARIECEFLLFLLGHENLWLSSEAPYGTSILLQRPEVVVDAVMLRFPDAIPGWIDRTSAEEVWRFLLKSRKTFLEVGFQIEERLRQKNLTY